MDFVDFEERYKKRKEEGSKSEAYLYDAEKRYLSRNAETIGKDITNRINNWLTNNKNYIDNAQYRFSNKNNSYRGDASDWLTTVTKQRENFGLEADSIKKVLTTYKDFFGEEYVSSVFKALDENLKIQDSVIEASTKDRDHWSQWDSEEAWKKDYDKAVAWQKDYDEKMSYDLEAGKTEIDRLNNILGVKDEITKLKNDIAILNQVKSDPYGTHRKEKEEKIKRLEAMEATWAHAMQVYGSEDAIRAMASEKGAYYTLAQRVQEGARLGGVSDPESEYYDPNFEKYSTLGNYMGWEQVGSMTADKNAGGILVYDDVKAAALVMNERWLSYELFKPEMQSSQDGFAGWVSNTFGNAAEYNTENIETIAVFRTMTDAEINTFAYYLAKDKENGTNLAEQYVASLRETLNGRMAKKIAAEKETDFSKYLFAIEAGLNQYEEGRNALFSDADYIPTSPTQQASGIIRENLEGQGIPLWYNFNEGKWENQILGSSTGQIFYDSLNTTANMLPSVLASTVTSFVNPALGGYVGSVALGMSAAGNAKAEMLNLGYSKEQANAYGIMVGASEALLEKLLGGIPGLSNGDGIFSSLGEKVLGKIDNALARAAITIGGNMLDEGLEEGLQTILEPWLKEVATSVDWEAANVDEVLYSSLLGALSSIGFGAADVVGGKINSNIQTNKYGQSIIDNGNVDSLKQLALEMYTDKSIAEQKKGNKLAEKVDRNASAKNVGKLATYMESTVATKNEAARTKALAEKGLSSLAMALTEKGLSAKVATKVAQYIMDSGKLSKIDKATIEGSSKIQKAINEVRETVNLDEGDVSSRLQDAIGTRQRAVKEIAERLAVDQTKADIESEAGAKFEASDNGKTVFIDAQGNAKDVTIKKVASTEGGLKLELEGGITVNASDLNFGTKEEALMYEMVARMEVTPETANEIIGSFKPSNVGQATRYFSTVPLAYRYGQMGYEAGLKNVALPDNLKKIAYNRGRMDAIAQDKTKTKTAKKGSAKTSTKKGGIIFENGYVYDESGANDLQKASMASIEVIEKMSNLEVHVFESYVNEKGERVYKVNGVEKPAPNGYYIEGGNKIYIDINAGNKGEGAMNYAMAHEIGHYIREWNAKGFRELGDFLLKEYGKQGVPVEALLRDQKEKIKKRYERNNETLPSEAKLNDMAYEELVCDAMSEMLADEKAYEKLAKLKQQNRSLWKKLGEAIKALLDKIKGALGIYSKYTPDAQEASFVRRFDKKTFDKLQDLYLKAFVKADNNFSNAEQTLADNGIAVNPDTNSASLLSVRYVLDDDQRKKVAKALAERFGVTQAEAMDWLKAETSLASLILNPKYSQYLDYTADPDEVAIKTNSDYPQGTVDFSNNCPKRRDFTEVMNRVLRNFPNHVFAATDLAKIRTIMEQEGMEVACAICYVEDRRQLDSVVAQDFIDSLALYRKGSKTRPDGKNFNTNQLKALKMVEGDTYTPSIYELISLEGRNSLKAKNPAMEEAWVKFNNARGMQSVRLLLNDAEYKRQILKYSPSVVKRKNEYGGLRIYSFSDMEMFHLIDIIQVLTDSATVGLSVQGYTKVNEYAKAVKDTGEKLNRSLIPKGDLGYHMENGRVVLDFDTVEGIDINHPDFFDNIDNPNVGNIVIGINATQIKAAMTSKFIDQIIPFHTGQSSEVLGEKGIAAWENYKDSQSERDVKTQKKSSHQINIYTEVINAAEAEGHPITNKVEFVNKFLQVCKENNLIPRFSDFLNVDENGDYVYTEGYHKFLVDFKTFDQNTGEYLPQMPVKPIFDNEYITKLLTDYVKSQQTKDAEFTKAMPKVLDRITKEIVKSDGVKSFDRDSHGNELSAKQKEFFKDSKVRDEDGNLLALYHGTTKGGFTVFDAAYSDDRRSLFFTSSKKTAQSYGITGNVFGDKDFEARSPIKTIDDAKAYFDSINWKVIEYKDGKYWDGKTLYQQWNKNIKYSLQNHQGHPKGNFNNEQELIDYAERSAQEADNRKVKTGLYEVYLNLKKPLIVDAKGHSWDQIDFIPPELEPIVKKQKENLQKIGEKIKELRAYSKERGISLGEAMDRDREYAKLGDEDVALQEEYDAFMEENGLSMDTSTRDISKYAKNHGYDGVLFKNIYDVGQYDIFGDTGMAEYIAVAFDSNQVKSASNKNPTSNPDIRHSDRDSLGNELSKAQAEFFKDSKVRDKKGNLMVLYHGTTANFNTFKKGDVGFHFGTKGAARGRVGFGKNVTLKEVYLNITNPIVFDEDLGSWDADYRLTEELFDRGILTQAEAEAVLLSDDKSYRRTTEAANKKLASLLVAKGYDGIAYSNTFETKNPTTSYIVFNSNQAKEITNKTPTASADIRYSGRADALDKSWGKRYNLYTATDDFIKEVAPKDRKAFSRSLAHQTSGMADGEIRTIYINSTAKVYAFRADGYMRGEMIENFSQSEYEKIIETRKEYLNEINSDRKTADLWLTPISDIGTESRGNISLSEGRGRSASDDLLPENASERNGARDTEREWTNPRTKEDYDEIVEKLREMLGMDTAKDSNSAERKFSDRYSDEKLDKLLEELLLDLDWGDLTQFGGDSDISIDDISEELNVEPERIEILIRRKGLGESHIEAGRTAVMKQARIDEAIEDSGAKHHPDYARKYITRISPKDFIDLTVSQNHLDRGQFDAEVKGDYGSRMSEYDYKKALQDSRSPYLSVDRSTGKVIGHNGRHRIRALEMAGIEAVEIEVQFFDEDGDLIKYNAETISDMAISSQFDTAIETHISTVIPLNEAHRAEIERIYGEKANPDAGVRFQDRDTDSYSNRSLLAGALESVAQNDIEKNKLSQYKEKIALIESEQKKLGEIRAKANELRFTKGRTSAETKQMKDLDFEATQIANRINTYDKQLLSLESTKALKNVLDREKANLRKRLEQKGKQALKDQKAKDAETIRELMNRHTESRKKAIEGRHKTEVRGKIKKVVSDLSKLLLNPTKEKHVPIGLQLPVAEALDAINMDTMNAEERVAYYNDLISKSSDPDEIEMLTKKRDFFEYRDATFKERITALKNAYAEFKESDDPLIRNAHNDAIEDLIKNTADAVGNKSLKDMSYEQLEAVYNMYKAILATVRNANKMFKEGRQETVTENSVAVKNEVRDVGGHQDRVLKLAKFFKKFGWDMLKPVTAMKVIGSKTFERLFNNVRAGEDTWAVDVNEAKEFYEGVSKKYGFKKWDFKKRYNFKDSGGSDFSLSLEQIMSLYAYSKRDQADKHLEFGGFIFDDAIEVTEKKLGIPLKYEVNDANPYRFRKEDLLAITDSLTKEQKAFVDEMQAYLSDVMGAKGNEVSLAMYDIKLYNEKNYFPLKTSRYFREFDPEKSGTPKIKNSGFSKKTIPQAGNPIVLSNFMDVWAGHVNDMSMYHAFVLPLEDLLRVYNYSSTAGGYDSVQQYIKNAYGAQANQYIERLMDDLNGGARVDSSAGVINKGLSLFKKASVFASASVVVQQPSAIARAFAYINPKYFATSAPSAMNLKKHKTVWAEVKKYAPVAVIKEMGYFDTGVGRSTIEWLKGNQTVMDKMDDALSKAPAMADELVWAHLWEAVKRETKATTNLKWGSEEFLKKCGERFTEVITNTQVYDSVLSRSGMMRSKDTGMKMATAFMAEPTTTVNMMVDGIIQGKRGNKKFTAATVGAVASSIILNSILVALVYAARDDDEDETYTEKYIGSVTSELLDGFNPLTYVPFIKDIWSIAQGYDVERSDMSVVSKLWESVEGLFKEDKSGWEKVLDVSGSVSSLFGIPLKNIIRDAKGMYNLTLTLTSGTQTTGAGISESVEDSFKSSIPLWDRLAENKSNADRLYEAILSGDQVQIERIKNRYKDEKAIESAMRQALRENDSRIKEAAKAKYEGDISEYTRIAKMIIAEGKFSQDTIVAAINAELNAIKKGETVEVEETEDNDEVTSIYSSSDINSAFDNGDTEIAIEIINDLIETKVANGMEEKNAKSSIKSSMTSYWKPLYKEAYKNGDTQEMYRIRTILLSSGLYGKTSDVIKTAKEWLKS